jgi:uncharacterized protein (TIGR02246 family)
MKTTEELIAEVVDREAVRDLPVRYCDCIWRKDIDGVVSLFADDATFVMKGIEVNLVSRGVGEIRKMHRKALSKTKPRLFVHNQLVNLLGAGRAASRCAVEVRNLGVTMEYLGIGYFEDEFVKEGDQWKFTSRVHSFDGIDNKIYLRTFMP